MERNVGEITARTACLCRLPGVHHCLEGLECLPDAHGEATALRRARQAVVSDAAQFIRAERGACPQINKPGAKIPFNVLCQVLSWDKALESC